MKRMRAARLARAIAPPGTWLGGEAPPDSVCSSVALSVGSSRMRRGPGEARCDTAHVRILWLSNEGAAADRIFIEPQTYSAFSEKAGKLLLKNTPVPA